MLQQGQTAEFTRLTIIPNENNSGYELETGNSAAFPRRLAAKVRLPSLSCVKFAGWLGI